ncbi:hypothetical protein [Novosphingobium sp.]|uniref:hypothetical protein n=1 Tax=Novosphingobium sp. TaxID=1874826 RepID=UPI0035AE31D1
MALSNAERQARYRARLKERAAPEALVPRVVDAADAAVAALWSFFSRPMPGGGLWADTEGCANLAEYRALLASEPGSLLRSCREVTSFGAGLLPHEADALRQLIALSEALLLTPRGA